MSLTHVDQNNNPKMVNVSEKNFSHRKAMATCSVILPKEIISLFDGKDIDSKKGPVFHTAIIAGTMGVKRTSETIPFCHQINIEGCNIDIKLNESIVTISCHVETYGKTGVEMEALTGAHVTALTIYDMCKALSHDIKITDLQLENKSGGKRNYAR